MQEQSGTNWVAADFFVHSHRISGRLRVRQRKLADQLLDPNRAFLQVEDAYVSNVDRPADITASHASAILRKDSVAAVVVSRQEDGLSSKYGYGSHFGVQLLKVFFIVSSFEIEGYLRLSSRMDLRTVMSSGTDSFLSILDGEMRSAIRPDVTFSGGAILVNKDQIGAFWVEENPENG